MLLLLIFTPCFLTEHWKESGHQQLNATGPHLSESNEQTDTALQRDGGHRHALPLLKNWCRRTAGQEHSSGTISWGLSLHYLLVSQEQTLPLIRAFLICGAAPPSRPPGGSRPPPAGRTGPPAGELPRFTALREQPRSPGGLVLKGHTSWLLTRALSF